MPIVPTQAKPSPRLLYIDNLRWTMIILVVSMHAAVTYSGVGSWYYTEKAHPSKLVLFVFVTYQAYLQAFFMGFLFFIAGFFVPQSYDKKGPSRFLRERAFRLGLPVLFYMFVLGPVTEYFVAHSWRPSEPSSFKREWIKHITDGEFLSGSGPLWFCLALLIFCAVYAAFRLISPVRVYPFPAPPPNTRLLCAFIAVVSIATFLVRLAQPSGSSFFNMQLANFSQYVAMFVAGILASRAAWLEKIPYETGVRWFILAATGGFALWVSILVLGGAFTGNAKAYGGGFHWQSAAYNLWESFVCVGICLGLLVWYRQKFNRQGRAARFLSDHAFSVYVFHPPIVIAAARLLHGSPVPALVKFLAVTGCGVVVSYAASAAIFRRIPGLRQIL